MLSLQHVATALPTLLLLLALAHVTGVSVETMPAILSATLLGMAVSTVLQAWGGRWGSGVFLVHSVEPALITVAAAAMAISGPGALATISFVAAITALGGQSHSAETACAVPHLCGRHNPLYGRHVPSGTCLQGCVGP